MNHRIFKTILDETFSTLNESESTSFHIELEGEDSKYEEDFLLTSGDSNYKFRFNAGIVCSNVADWDDNNIPTQTLELVRVDIDDVDCWIKGEPMILTLENRYYLEACLFANIDFNI